MANKENIGFVNLAAHDPFLPFLHVLSESDEELEGKRVRTYSYDPEKFDVSEHNESDWKQSPEDERRSTVHKEPKYNSHVIMQKGPAKKKKAKKEAENLK